MCTHCLETNSIRISQFVTAKYFAVISVAQGQGLAGPAPTGCVDTGTSNINMNVGIAGSNSGGIPFSSSPGASTARGALSPNDISELHSSPTRNSPSHSPKIARSPSPSPSMSPRVFSEMVELSEWEFDFVVESVFAHTPIKCNNGNAEVVVPFSQLLPEILGHSLGITKIRITDIERQIGSGGFAKVYLAKYQDKDVAVKEIKMGQPDEYAKKFKEFFSEVSIMSYVDFQLFFL